MNAVPQPHVTRLTPFGGHPVVAGIAPDQPEIVVVTAAELAVALGGRLYVAYADPGRVVEREFPDGRVLHSDLDPDLSDDEDWPRRLSAVVLMNAPRVLTPPGSVGRRSFVKRCS